MDTFLDIPGILATAIKLPCHRLGLCLNGQVRWEQPYMMILYATAVLQMIFFGSVYSRSELLVPPPEAGKSVRNLSTVNSVYGVNCLHTAPSDPRDPNKPGCGLDVRGMPTQDGRYGIVWV